MIRSRALEVGEDPTYKGKRPPRFLRLPIPDCAVESAELGDFIKLKNPAATALMVKMNIRPEDRVKVKLQVLRLLVTMRLDREKMDLIAGFMESYLKLSAKE